MFLRIFNMYTFILSYLGGGGWSEFILACILFKCLWVFVSSGWKESFFSIGSMLSCFIIGLSNSESWALIPPVTPTMLQQLEPSRRSSPLFPSPRCSYASRLCRQQCSSNLLAAHWARLHFVSQGYRERGDRLLRVRGYQSPSAQFKRHPAAGDDIGRLKWEYTRKTQKWRWTLKNV